MEIKTILITILVCQLFVMGAPDMDKKSRTITGFVVAVCILSIFFIMP